MITIYESLKTANGHPGREIKLFCYVLNKQMGFFLSPFFFSSSKQLMNHRGTMFVFLAGKVIRGAQYCCSWCKSWQQAPTPSQNLGTILSPQPHLPLQLTVISRVIKYKEATKENERTLKIPKKAC